jgi:hypothetical protein
VATSALTVKGLLGREYEQGVTVTNCIPHMHLPILDRPQDCPRCQTDVRNTLSRALRANEWLNEWKEDATFILRALQTAGKA